MNILFNCGNYYPHRGGAESLIEDLSSLFVKKGHRVTVLTRRWNDTLLSEEKRKGVRIVRIPFPIEYYRVAFSWSFFHQSIAVLWKIHRLLKREKIETVCIGLFDLSSFYLWLLSYVMKFKFVIYLHGGEMRSLQKTSKFYWRFLSRALNKCDAVIAVSDGLKKEVVQFAPFVEKKVWFIPNGVDLTAIKAEQYFSHSKKYILYVGRLVPEKNVKTIIEAFSRIYKKIADVDLFIIGTGHEEEKLRKMVSENGLSKKVSFLGSLSRKKVFSMLRGAEFVVTASYSEGFPIVGVEALAAGKMMIGSKVRGITEVIEEGKNGIFFDPDDANTLAKLMVKYVNDRNALNELEQNIKDMNLEKYDIKNLAEQHLDVLEHACRL